MNQKFSYIQSFKIIVLALLVAVGTGYLFADFSAPTQAPPGCPAGSPGCDAPVNVSATAQAKNGSLTLGASTPASDTGSSYSLQVPNKYALFKGLTTQALTLTTGAGAGKVLTSNANGSATWHTLGTCGSGEFVTGFDPTGSVVCAAPAAAPAANLPDAPSLFYDFSQVVANNTGMTKVVGLLKSGTYTFSGSVTTKDNGGGGNASVFFNSSGSLTILEARDFIRPMCGGIAASGGTGSSYKMYYSGDVDLPGGGGSGANLLFCLKRNGSNDGIFTIPDTTIVVTSPMYVYVYGAQVTITGYINSK